MSDCSTHAFDVPLKSCPFCSAEPEVLSDGWRTWGLVQHNEGCLFPVYPKHEIPESDFAAWNTRHQCGLTNEDYNILLDELGVSEQTCEMEYSSGVPEFVSLDTWTCSECGSPIYNDCEPSYCEYCGAKVVSA